MSIFYNVSENNEIQIFFMERIVNVAKMSHPKRYFLNTLPDYSGKKVQISTSDVKDQVYDTIRQVLEGQPPSENGDGGLYASAGGIGYMFYHLSQSSTLSNEREYFLKHGITYITKTLNYVDRHDSSPKSAFLLGNSGIYAVAAALLKEVGEEEKAKHYLDKYIELANVCKPLDYIRYGDELLVGRAGYLCGAIWLKKIFGPKTIPEKVVVDICSAIIKSGRRRKSQSPLMYSYYGTEYLGAAHGLSSILQVLLHFPSCLQTIPGAEQDVKGAVDFLLSLQRPSGNFPCATDELQSRSRPEDEELIHWCHGAPGVVYLMAKAYLHWKDNKYLQSCLKCGEVVWKKGLLRKGPGICHGIAGNGYVFLLLYRLTGDEKHLHRSHMFAEFLKTTEFKQGARTPDCPFSLYEGLAGTACFLADLMNPETATFPFFDVFQS